MIRIELVIAVLLSAFIILNGYFQTNLTNAYIYKLVARFFGYSPLMGPFIAVFAAYLWGTDYEYGTLRNKLICAPLGVCPVESQAHPEKQDNEQ